MSLWGTPMGLHRGRAGPHPGGTVTPLSSPGGESGLPAPCLWAALRPARKTERAGGLLQGGTGQRRFRARALGWGPGPRCPSEPSICGWPGCHGLTAVRSPRLGSRPPGAPLGPASVGGRGVAGSLWSGAPALARPEQPVCRWRPRPCTAPSPSPGRPAAPCTSPRS